MRGLGLGTEVYRGLNSSEAGVQTFWIMWKASVGHVEAVVKNRQQDEEVLQPELLTIEGGWLDDLDW